jgi:hypothetical protein
MVEEDAGRGVDVWVRVLSLNRRVDLANTQTSGGFIVINTDLSVFL